MMAMNAASVCGRACSHGALWVFMPTENAQSLQPVVPPVLYPERKGPLHPAGSCALHEAFHTPWSVTMSPALSCEGR